MSIKIIQKPSKNFSSRNGWRPDLIVNHITAGNNVNSAINWFQSPNNQQSSAHFIVDLDGTIYQCVQIDKMAWAQGTSTNPSSNMYYGKSKLPLVQSRKTNCNYYSIGIEHVNASGGILTPAQLAATIELHKYIISEVKRIYGITIPVDRSHISGHCFVNPITKPCCPGASFPYDKILAGLNGSNEATISPLSPHSNSTPSNIKTKIGTAITKSNLNMRNGASTNNSVITTVPINTTIMIDTILDNGWSLVEYTGKSGYCSNDYLNFSTKTVVGTDTTGEVHISPTGYQFALYSPKGEKPYITVGTANIFDLNFVKQEGNYFYYKLIPKGAKGTKVGIYTAVKGEQTTKRFIAIVG